MRRLILVLTLVLVLAAAPGFAQGDRAAGLFAAARQLPLVGHSATVRVDGAEATVELVQVFANPGGDVAQADLRLHLPREATVTGFGFWRDGSFLAAELREREEAERAHRAAADSGRATGLLTTDGATHAFSVYPIAAGALQQVETTLRLPVVSERGRSHVRLPFDAFLGQAAVPATVVVHLATPEPLRAVGVDGVPVKTLARGDRAARLAFTADRAVDLWWAEEAPPLLVRAEAVELADGELGVQVRVLLHDAAKVLGARRADPGEIVLLVDTSYSMRRRAAAIGDLAARVAGQTRRPVRLVAVGERTAEVAPARRDDAAAELAARLFTVDAGFATTWSDLAASAAVAGCGAERRRCLVVTDPQVAGLADRAPGALGEGVDVLFLADADEAAHFAAALGDDALVHQPDAAPRAALLALADELVLPVVEVRALDQPGGTFAPLGTPRLRAAEGALLRLYGTAHGTTPLAVELAIGDRVLHREVAVEVLDPASGAGQTLRRGAYREVLAGWMREYRRERDPALRERIVAVSLREAIPTPLTALHVADPEGVLPPTATPAALLRGLGVALLLLAMAVWRRAPGTA